MSEVVYFDSCVFLAWLRGEKGRADVVGALFGAASSGKLKILSSALTIAEVLNIQGFKSPIPKEQREKVRSLFKNEWIVIRSVTRRVAETSQKLVWEDGIKPKDGVHVATAMVYKVPKLYSYDRKLISKGELSTNSGRVSRRVSISEPQQPEPQQPEPQQPEPQQPEQGYLPLWPPEV